MEKTFSKLKKISGLTWSSFSHSYGHYSSGDETSNDEECKSDTHSLRLCEDDKAMYGCYPFSEVFELAVCNYCNLKFKTSALADHIRLRHEDGKATEKKEVEDKKLVIQSKNRGRHKKGAAKLESKKLSAVASSSKELGAPKLLLSINEKLVLRECPVPSLSLGPNTSNLTQSSPSSSSTPSTPPVGTPTLTPATTPNVTPTGTPVGTPSITPNLTPVKSYDLSKHSSTLHEIKIKGKQKVKSNKAQEKSSGKNGKNVQPVQTSSKVKEKSKKRGSKKNSVKETPSNNQDSTSTKVENCDKPKSNKGTSLQDYPKLSLLVSIKNPDLLKQMQKNRDDSKAERNEVKVEKDQQKSQSSSAVKGSQLLKDEPAKASSPQLQEVIRATLKQSQVPTLILRKTQSPTQPQVCVSRNNLNLTQKELLQQEALKALHRQQMLKCQNTQQSQSNTQSQPAQQHITGIQKHLTRQNQQGVNTQAYRIAQDRHKQFLFSKDHAQKQQSQILKPVVVQGASRSLVVNNSNLNDSKRQVRRNVIMSKAKENGRDIKVPSQFSTNSLRSLVQPSSSSPPSDSQENKFQWLQPGFKRFGGLLVSRVTIPYKRRKIDQSDFPMKSKSPNSHLYFQLNHKGEKPKEETEKPAEHLPLKDDGRPPMLHFVKFNNRMLRKNDIPTTMKLFPSFTPF